MGIRALSSLLAFFSLLFCAGFALNTFPSPWVPTTWVLPLPGWVSGLLSLVCAIMVCFAMLIHSRHRESERFLQTLLQVISRHPKNDLLSLPKLPTPPSRQDEAFSELTLTLSDLLIHWYTEWVDTRRVNQDLTALATFLLQLAQTNQSYLEKSALILSKLNLGIQIRDLQGKILFENYTFDQLSALVQRELAALVPLATRHVTDQAHQNRYTLKHPTHVLEVQIQNLSPDSAHSEALGPVTLIVIEDVTAQEEVRNTQLKSERWNGMVRMSAQLSHEIRNPLNAINLNLEMIREDLESGQGSNGETLELLKATFSQTDRLKELSEQSLRLHKIFEDGSVFEAQKVIRDVVASLTPLAAKQGSEIRLAMETHPLRVTGDRQALFALTQNIVQNALDAMPSGGRIWVRLKSRRGATLHLAIKDEGPGIPKAHRPQVFEPFYTTKATGTGLGLAVVHHAVHHLRGEVQVYCGHPKSGRGTLFSISIPLPPVAPSCAPLVFQSDKPTTDTVN